MIDNVLQVHFTKLNRINPDLVRKLVHQRFNAKTCLRMTGRTHGARGIFVCVNRNALAVEVRHSVDVRLSGLRAVAKTAELILRSVKRNDFSITTHSSFELLPRAGAIASEKELILAREHQLDWG